MIFSRLSLSVIITCFLVLYPFANTEAFDGKRKGFFLGVGAGAGISAESSYDSFYGRLDFTLNYKLGYAPSERLLLYLTLRSSLDGGYTYNYYNEGEFHRKNLDDNNGTFGFGFMLFPSQRNNLYFSGSFGWGATIDLYYFLTDSVGYGVSGGVGYEVFPHLAVDLTLDYRRLTYVGGYDYEAEDFFYSSEVFEDPPDHLLTLSLAFNFLLY